MSRLPVPTSRFLQGLALTASLAAGLTIGLTACDAPAARHTRISKGTISIAEAEVPSLGLVFATKQRPEFVPAAQTLVAEGSFPTVSTNGEVPELLGTAFLVTTELQNGLATAMATHSTILDWKGTLRTSLPYLWVYFPNVDGGKPLVLPVQDVFPHPSWSGYTYENGVTSTGNGRNGENDNSPSNVLTSIEDADAKVLLAYFQSRSHGSPAVDSLTLGGRQVPAHELETIESAIREVNLPVVLDNKFDHEKSRDRRDAGEFWYRLLRKGAVEQGEYMSNTRIADLSTSMIWWSSILRQVAPENRTPTQQNSESTEAIQLPPNSHFDMVALSLELPAGLDPESLSGAKLAGTVSTAIRHPLAQTTRTLNNQFLVREVVTITGYRYQPEVDIKQEGMSMVFAPPIFLPQLQTEYLWAGLVSHEKKQASLESEKTEEGEKKEEPQVLHELCVNGLADLCKVTIAVHHHNTYWQCLARDLSALAQPTTQAPTRVVGAGPVGVSSSTDPVVASRCVALSYSRAWNN